MIVPPTVGPLWDSEIQRELRSCLRWYLPCGLSVCMSVCLSTLVPTVWPVLARLPPPSLPPCKCRNAYTPNAGSPLCGIPQSSNFVASRRVPTLLHPFGEQCNLSLTSCVYDCPALSEEHCNLSLTSCVCDCPAYCWPSLGLGNTA